MSYDDGAAALAPAGKDVQMDGQQTGGAGGNAAPPTSGGGAATNPTLGGRRRAPGAPTSVLTPNIGYGAGMTALGDNPNNMAGQLGLTQGQLNQQAAAAPVDLGDRLYQSPLVRQALEDVKRTITAGSVPQIVRRLIVPVAMLGGALAGLGSAGVMDGVRLPLEYATADLQWRGNDVHVTLTVDVTAIAAAAGGSGAGGEPALTFDQLAHVGQIAQAASGPEFETEVASLGPASNLALQLPDLVRRTGQAMLAADRARQANVAVRLAHVSPPNPGGLRAGLVRLVGAIQQQLRLSHLRDVEFDFPDGGRTAPMHVAVPSAPAPTPAAR